MVSHQEIRRRSSAADRHPLSESVAAAARAQTTTLTASPEMSPSPRDTSPSSFDDSSRSGKDTPAETASMPPPPLPRTNSVTRGHSRASSSLSRHKNRLSLTLPVSIPLSEGVQLTESPVITASATPISIPQTPLETPGSVVTSPSNANEFIIAIAAQERRVLELREELARAESDLAKLKKQWASEEVYRKRSDSQRAAVAPVPAVADEDALLASRRSVEQDRRKLLLQTQGTTTPSRRRVMRGGHARTLSLLSPVRADDGSTGSEENKLEAVTLPSVEERMAQLINPNLAKRSSWQPRSQQTAAVPGMPQLVADLKLGFRAFVEDIRQITVGDEPVSGQASRATPAASNRHEDELPSRASTKGNTGTSSEPPSSVNSTSQVHRTPEPKGKAGRMKHFSWTPLGFDSLDDTDWSNWDSPISTKSARWSGSTMNSSGIDDIPENDDEEVTKAKKKTKDAPLLSPTLDEIFPSVVNKLSPSNLKRTANNLMEEWEKSLMAPESRSKAGNS